MFKFYEVSKIEALFQNVIMLMIDQLFLDKTGRIQVLIFLFKSKVRPQIQLNRIFQYLI